MIKLKKGNDLDELIRYNFLSRERSILGKFYFSTKAIPLFVKFFLKTNLTPNHITLLGFLCSILAATCLCFGNHLYLILAAFLIQIGFILDIVDGMIANIKKMSSTYGWWLDLTTDSIGKVILIFCASFGLFHKSGDITHLYIGIIGSMLVGFTSFATQNAAILRPKEYVSETREQVEQKLGIDVADFLRGAGAILLWLTIGALLNLIYYVLVLYFIVFQSAYLVRLFIIYRKHLAD